MLETTRIREDGVEGSGVPKAFVLGKGLRAPRGWELALSSAQQPLPPAAETSTQSLVRYWHDGRARSGHGPGACECGERMRLIELMHASAQTCGAARRRAS